MMEFISLTTETRERRGDAVMMELRSTGDGVGIGTLKMRIEDQRVVYASRRGIKTIMVDVTKGRAVDGWREERDFLEKNRILYPCGGKG